MTTPQNSDRAPHIGRRDALKAAGAAAVLGGIASATPATASAAVPQSMPGSGYDWWLMQRSVAKRPLRFGKDGKFRILQFNDTQDHHLIDKRTLELMNKAIAEARPELVIINGDVINGGPQNLLQHKQAMNNVAATLDANKVPWAITFGNHDEDSTKHSGLDETAMMAFYMQYEYNVNIVGPKGLTGTGNMYLPLLGSTSDTPVGGVWLVDSGRYAPEKIDGQNFDGYPDWDWVRAEDVKWYHDLSTAIERRHSKLIPSLMFLHIPLWEYRFMWYSSVDERTDAVHERAVKKHTIDGERNEAECPGPFNSGLFSAILGRGETMSVSAGHDHVNAYWGNYYGVQMGYGPGSGYGAYGLGGDRDHHLRGGRLFVLNEGDGQATIESTEVIFARDLNIDVTAGHQRISEPLAFPKGVR